MAEFTVGQEVLLINTWTPSWRTKTPPQTVTIARVGRKYVYVERYGQETAYHADTGFLKTQYTASERLMTRDDWAQMERAKAARRDLIRNKVTVDPLSRTTWTDERLVALRDEARTILGDDWRDDEES